MNNSEIFNKNYVIDVMVKCNKYFMEKWTDVGKRIMTEISRASNIWTRSVYYEGLMEIYKIEPRPEFYDYVMKWAEFHNWDLRDGRTYTRNADNQCAGQIYIELYKIDPQPEKIKAIELCIDNMLKSPKINDWDWIDALQMAMPVFAQLGVLFKDERYFERMHQMYLFTKDTQGGGLYNYDDHLWWRDAKFKPPYKEPNGKNCYWSRGNGWVAAALVRVLSVLPKNDERRSEYLDTLRDMLAALKIVQRKDGFWNVSLHDPDNYGGRETTGTSLFTYAMAWAVNKNLVDKNEYGEIVQKAWKGLTKYAVHPNGFLGYIQGTGAGPVEGQPVTYDHEPDFNDFGLGCFLLAASEIYRMCD